MLRLLGCCCLVVMIAGAGCGGESFSADDESAGSGNGTGGSGGSSSSSGGSGGSAGMSSGGASGSATDGSPAGGAAGASGSAGSPDAGPDCVSLLETVYQRLEIAKRCCAPCAVANQCSGNVPGVCCAETVNFADSPDTDAYLEALGAWQEAGCFAACPKSLCPITPSNNCLLEGHCR